jgi:anti-anti-sigma factor
MFSTDIKNENGVCTIQISGSVSLKNAVQMKDIIIQQADSGNLNVVLEFSDTVYLDSSGIGAIFNAQKYLTEKNGTLKLKNVSKDVMTILKIANLDKHLDIIS